jgi:hypothetical protein
MCTIMVLDMFAMSLIVYVAPLPHHLPQGCNVQYYYYCEGASRIGDPAHSQ